MSPLHDREDQAFRSAYAVMVEDTPHPPEWEELRPAIRLAPKPVARRGVVIALAASFIVLVLVGGITLLLISFGSEDPVIDQVPPPTSLPVTSLPEASPTTIPSPTTTVVPSTTTTLSPVVLETSTSEDGLVAITTGLSDGKVVFTLSHGFDQSELDLTREPNVSLTDLGDRGAAFVTIEGIRHQAEIHRLWPPDQAVDVVWLTDRVTKDAPDEGETFTLYDTLTLEGELDRFALHADCRGPEFDAGATLLSFDTGTPVVLMAWQIDSETMTFAEVSTSGVELGECLEVTTRD